MDLEHLQVLSEEVSEEILFAVLGRRWCPPGGGTGHSPDLVAAPGAGRPRVLPMSLQFSSLLVTGLTQGDLFISTCPAMHGMQDALVVQPFSCAK